MRTGWFKESYRHSLAARGISTVRRNFILTNDDWLRSFNDSGTRYKPEREDKVILVDLDSTIADIEDIHTLKSTRGFDFIDEIGVKKFRELMAEDGYGNEADRIVGAYEKYKSGDLPSFVMNPGSDMQVTYDVFERPGMKEKLKDLSKRYRLVLYTAAGPIYAQKALEAMDMDDLFEDVYSRPFLDQMAVENPARVATEGLKPLTPIAERLGVRRKDLLLLDDNGNVVGPDNEYRWVQSPGVIFPTEHQMKPFLREIEQKLAKDKEGEYRWKKPFVPEHGRERVTVLPPMPIKVPDSTESLHEEVHSKPMPFFRDDEEYMDLK